MVSLTFEQMVTELQGSCKLKSTNQYVRYIWQLDKVNNQQTKKWINNAIQGNQLVDPIEEALKPFDAWSHNFGKNYSPKTISNWKTAYKQLATSVLGIFYANVWAFSNNSAKIDETLCQIVAQNALFASNDIVNAVKIGKQGTPNNIGIGNQYASWDRMQTFRDMKNKGTIVKVLAGDEYYECRADDNTYANRYIKKAVSISKGIKGDISKVFVGYEACHVWDMPDDPRYYASIANIVLLPRAFGQLTDHNDSVKQLLRYRVWDLFNFKPKGEKIPVKPKNYENYQWR